MISSSHVLSILLLSIFDFVVTEPIVNDDLTDPNNVPEKAFFGAYPFMVSIGKKGDKNGPYTQRQGHFCGGALVTKRHVVTAAHCFVGEKPSSVRVLVGISNFDDVAEVIDVESWKIYNEYEKKKLDGDDHDIAVLKLKKEVTYYLAKTIPIYDRFFDKDDIELESIGWGTTERYNTSPDLLKIPLKIVPRVTCEKDLIRESGQPIYINMWHICTRSTKKQLIATGDSGGPVIYSDNDVQKLIGVNEAQCKKSCSRINTHARIYNYRDFIKDMIQK